MRYLLKIVIVGILIWILSLVWIEINSLLMWPLFAGVIGGMVPAYLFGRSLRRYSRPQTVKTRSRYADPTRPSRLQPRPDLATGPTRPSRVLSTRDRAARPTRPMPAM